jgi:hypothetical protein
MTPLQYILDENNKPVEADLFLWAAWMDNQTNRIVGYTQINSQVEVSTVFLGLDHNFSNEGPPILFETMIFGGSCNENQWRWRTWDEAKAGHEFAVLTARLATRPRWRGYPIDMESGK